MTASANTATIGYARFASWFQTLTSVTARAIGLVPNPQTLRIPNWPAMPTAAPPGATIESAVEACVIISAGQKRSPGSATIHGGANVQMLRAVAATSATIHGHEISLTTPQTSR